jgi:ABC-type phosphate transport system substrate-binding protein
MQMRATHVVILALLVRGAIALAQPTASAPPYRVIVNPRNSIASADRSFLADAFLKKTTRWRSGDVILPADLGADSPVRRKFTEDVLNRSVTAVRSYWQQMIFSGRDIPPPELDSDEEVVRYVVKHPGAVGYVSGSADVGAAKVVSVK